MYQPELGRFLQPDPKQFAAGDYNLYRYCHNPVNKVDPFGLAPEWMHVTLVIGTVEPTPFADLTNAVLYGTEGNKANAAISVAGVLPHLGDAAKVLKYGARAAHWAKPSTLARHFKDHGADFAAKNVDDYAKKASEFLKQSQANKLPTKIGPDGTIRVYDPKTNTFGAYHADGTTKTFFKPESPTYFDRQPGIDLRELNRP
jgi:uncharacterized protein RhaS with RHS repeats